MYEATFKQHFRSGFHKGIDFNKFTQRKISDYIHFLMAEHDGLFEKATQLVHQNVFFCESCNANKGSSTNISIKIPQKLLSGASVKGNAAEKERFNDVNEICVQNL